MSQTHVALREICCYLIDCLVFDAGSLPNCRLDIVPLTDVLTASHNCWRERLDEPYLVHRPPRRIVDWCSPSKDCSRCVGRSRREGPGPSFRYIWHHTETFKERYDAVHAHANVRSGRYKCGYCHAIFDESSEATDCRCDLAKEPVGNIKNRKSKDRIVFPTSFG